ncbi:MAG TPA: ABC transporter ATP-binding protein [Chloroflexota bacterium]|nr:ABC transporter ATP-binding protein [Chloroflexota bacterium]
MVSAEETKVVLTGEEALDAPSPAIHTQDLAKRYGRTIALTGLTMTVGRGEIFGFLGPNGAGKTTAVKLLVGLIHPTAGQGWVLGKPLGDRETRRRIGYLPELFRYQDWLSGREVLDLHCDLAGIPREQRRNEIDSALATVGLGRRGEDRVGTYSKGMQQRLGLGVALLGNPELVFLDEPTSALDPVGRHDVREIIRGLKERGTTVFLNSHLLNEVEQVCDRVAVINRGGVLAIGTLDEIRVGEASVRLRLTRVGPPAEEILRRAGARDEGEWQVIPNLSDDAVPDLVARLVAVGAAIHAVEPARSTLEDEFLHLLGGRDAGPDNPAA